MIPRYTDHAANERTFLAWVRTALALIAFGSVLAKFDIFLRIVATQHAAKTTHTYGPTAELGLAFVALGIILLLTSYRRFTLTRNTIANAEENRPPKPGAELTLTVFLVILAAAVLAVLVKTLAS